MNLSVAQTQQNRTWQQELRQSLTTLPDFVRAGLISAEQAQDPRWATLFRENLVRVTPHVASLIDLNGTHCPIRLQSVPSLERETDPTLPLWLQEWSTEIYGSPVPWRADAIGDLAHLQAPRLTHRYGNRALLHVSDHCALWCRFCFRKSHLNEKEEGLYAGQFDEALSYITKTPAITELILTGGDPLSLGDEPLSRLLDRLADIPHLKHVRIHSRMAVTLPARITDGLIATLARTRPFALAVTSHFNHPKELAPANRAALRALKDAGVTLLNQSVLLKGVNDRAECLAELFQSLYEKGVIPFWLHHPDWTPGTMGFRTTIEEGLELYRRLFGMISGPALPHYVLDLPGGLGKIPLNDARIRLLQARTADGYHAGVYELPLPQTRAGAPNAATTRYLDLRKE